MSASDRKIKRSSHYFPSFFSVFSPIIISVECAFRFSRLWANETALNYLPLERSCVLYLLSITLFILSFFFKVLFLHFGSSLRGFHTEMLTTQAILVSEFIASLAGRGL